MIVAAAIAWVVTPHVLLLMYPRRSARRGMALVWVASGFLAAWYFYWSSHRAHEARVDMATVHSYPLSDSAGSHRVEIARLSQGSMEGWVNAEPAPPKLEALRKIHWSSSQDVSVEWFGRPTRYDWNPPSSIFLFHVRSPVEKNPVVFDYVCDQEQAGLLKSCSLLVRHDLRAMDALTGRATGPSPVPELLFAWGLLWLVIQLGLEIRLRFWKGD